MLRLIHHLPMIKGFDRPSCCHNRIVPPQWGFPEILIFYGDWIGFIFLNLYYVRPRYPFLWIWLASMNLLAFIKFLVLPLKVWWSEIVLLFPVLAWLSFIGDLFVTFQHRIGCDVFIEQCNVFCSFPRSFYTSSILPWSPILSGCYAWFACAHDSISENCIMINHHQHYSLCDVLVYNPVDIHLG